jgi:uncharacterized membrane protein
MIKKLFTLLFLLFSSYAWGSAPSSSFTYVSGTVINPTQVQTNENNIYSYLQSGVDTYKSGSITSAAISSTAGITYSQLNLGGGILPTDVNTSVTTNIYTFGGITVPNTATFNGNSSFTGGTITIGGTTGNQGQVIESQGTGTPQWGYPSGQLGSWSSPTCGSTFQAATDLFVTATSATSNNVMCITDSSASPSTVRNICPATGGTTCSCAMVVKKNDFWKITPSSTCTDYAIPIGS